MLAGPDPGFWKGRDPGFVFARPPVVYLDFQDFEFQTAQDLVPNLAAQNLVLRLPESYVLLAPMIISVFQERQDICVLIL